MKKMRFYLAVFIILISCSSVFAGQYTHILKKDMDNDGKDEIIYYRLVKNNFVDRFCISYNNFDLTGDGATDCLGYATSLGGADYYTLFDIETLNKKYFGKRIFFDPEISNLSSQDSSYIGDFEEKYSGDEIIIIKRIWDMNTEKRRDPHRYCAFYYRWDEDKIQYVLYQERKTNKKYYYNEMNLNKFKIFQFDQTKIKNQYTLEEIQKILECIKKNI